MCQWKLQIRSPKTSNGEKRGILCLSSPNFCHWKLQAFVTENFKWITENFKLLSPITSNLFHWKLQERITENFKWISPNLIKKTWETPGGVPTYRRAFYVGSVGCLQCLLMPDFCQTKNLPSFLSYWAEWTWPPMRGVHSSTHKSTVG